MSSGATLNPNLPSRQVLQTSDIEMTLVTAPHASQGSIPAAATTSPTANHQSQNPQLLILAPPRATSVSATGHLRAASEALVGAPQVVGVGTLCGAGGALLGFFIGGIAGIFDGELHHPPLLDPREMRDNLAISYGLVAAAMGGVSFALTRTSNLAAVLAMLGASVAGPATALALPDDLNSYQNPVDIMKAGYATSAAIFGLAVVAVCTYVTIVECAMAIQCHRSEV